MSWRCFHGFPQRLQRDTWSGFEIRCVSLTRALSCTSYCLLPFIFMSPTETPLFNNHLINDEYDDVKLLESSWNVMAHSDAREGKWRRNWRMQWVASTLHTTSEYGVSSITTADALTSAASSRLNWRPPGRFKWTRPFRAKDEFWFLRVCRHISNAI